MRHTPFWVITQPTVNNFLPTFRENLSQLPRAKNLKIVEDGADDFPKRRLVINHCMLHNKGRYGAFVIAARYVLDGPDIESRWGEILLTRLDRPWGPPNPLYNGYRAFAGGKATGAWRPPTPT
jgi:hypothetical protein